MKISHPLTIFSICVASIFNSVNAAPSCTDEEKEESFLHVVNNTGYSVDHIIRWTCDYLDIYNVTICVSFQTRYFGEDGFVIKQGDIYYIYLKENLLSTDLILIHELIHIKQYETGDLLLTGNSSVVYKGRRINLKNTDYDERAYEIVAHTQDSKILREYYKYRRSLMAHQEGAQEII